jgi:prophage regulatory protein
MDTTCRTLRKLITFNELSDRGIPYSRRQIDRLEKDSSLIPPFPKRVRIGLNRIGWVAAEIEAYIDAQIVARSTAAGTLGSVVGIQRRRGRKNTKLKARITYLKICWRRAAASPARVIAVSCGVRALLSHRSERYTD